MPFRFGEPLKFDSPLSLAPDNTIPQKTLHHVVVDQPFPIRTIVQRQFLVVLVRDIGLQLPRSEDLSPSSAFYTVGARGDASQQFTRALPYPFDLAMHRRFYNTITYPYSVPRLERLLRMFGQKFGKLLGMEVFKALSEDFSMVVQHATKTSTCILSPILQEYGQTIPPTYRIAPKNKSMWGIPTDCPRQIVQSPKGQSQAFRPGVLLEPTGCPRYCLSEFTILSTARSARSLVCCW